VVEVAGQAPAREDPSRKPSTPAPNPASSGGGGSNKAYARELYSVTLKLYDYQYNVIPVGPDKRPLVKKWSSKERASLGELKESLRKATGLAIVAGPENYWGDVKHYLVGIDVDDPRARDKSPKLSWVLDNTAAWKTGPRCPRCYNKHLEILEPGRRFKCPTCDLEFTLEEAARGLGALVIVSEELVKKYLGGSTQRLGPVEIMVNTYQLVPPSLHPTGVSYEWIRPLDLSLPNHGLLTLEEEDLKQLLEELRSIAGVGLREAKPKAEARDEAEPRVEQPRGEAEATRALSEDELKRIRDLLLEYYVPGHRDKIVFSLLGLLLKSGVSYESAKRLVELIATEAGDEEARQRLYLVDYHYGKRANILGVEKLRGVAGLKEELEAVLGERGLGEDEIAKKVSETISELYDMLGVSRAPRGEPGRLADLEGDEFKNDVMRILTEAGTLTKRITMMASRLKKAVLEHFKYVKNLHVDGVDLGLYCWDGKRYTLCEANIESWIEDMYNKLGLEEHGLRFTVLKKEIMEMLSDATRQPLKYEEAVIAFENCAFNWDTLTCEPHNPERLITHYIPHQIDIELLMELLAVDSISEDAVLKIAPKTLKAFKEWAGDKWLLLFEILGFTLYPRPYKKAVLLTDAKDMLGKGNTGKSTYIRYLQGILGRENYSVVAAQEFTRKNQDKGKVSMIYRKLANFYPDLPEEALENIGEFKVVTGEDAIPIRMLYKQAFLWEKPYVKHIYSANKPPVVRNADDAFWDRWLVLEFIGNFKEKVKNFEKTLHDEIPKAIAIGIAACHKVLKRGAFSLENTPEDAKIEWLSRSDSIFSFILWVKSAGALVEDPTGKTLIEKLYPYYARYCGVRGLNAVRQEDFTRWLKSHGFEVKSPQHKSTIYGYKLNAEILEQLLREEEGEETPEPENYGGLDRYYEY
jgi:phage/plasmid-associated DNA primase